MKIVFLILSVCLTSAFSFGVTFDELTFQRGNLQEEGQYDIDSFVTHASIDFMLIDSFVKDDSFSLALSGAYICHSKPCESVSGEKIFKVNLPIQKINVALSQKEMVRIGKIKIDGKELYCVATALDFDLKNNTTKGVWIDCSRLINNNISSQINLIFY